MGSTGGSGFRGNGTVQGFPSVCNSLLSDVQAFFDHSGMSEAGQFLLIYEQL